MFKQLTAISLMILLSAVASIAHENSVHVMGTVTDLDETTVTVKTADSSVSLTIEDATTYIKDGQAMTRADLQVGLRVMIEAMVDEDTNAYRAEEVTLGVMDPAVAAESHDEDHDDEDHEH